MTQNKPFQLPALDDDQIAIRADEVRVGDRLDLSSSPFFYDEPLAHSEYDEVIEVDRETQGCVAIYGNAYGAGYPVESILHVRTPRAIVYLASEAGCWFDGSCGRYNDRRIINEAVGRGFDLDGADLDALEQGDDAGDIEAWSFLMDEAIEYLDDLAPEGYYVGFNHGGDFGLWEWNEENIG